MITLNSKILASAIIAGLLVIASIFALSIQQKRAQGSVEVSHGYQSTTTPNGVVDLTNLCPQGNGSLPSKATGILGSIVLTGPNLGNIQIYDATTTIAANRVPPTASSSILLADIPAVSTNGTSTGTYTFDATFKSGLLVDMVGSVATATITYRCNE